MISFNIQDHRFQLRAAAICFRNDNAEVLLHRLDGDLIWALPGGRVEPGENAASTVVREMQEEIGEAITCERLLFVVENFYVDRSMPNHEVGFYFLAGLSASSKLLHATESQFGVEGDKRLEFRWFATSQLASCNLYPAFLRTALREPLSPFQHIVQRD